MASGAQADVHLECDIIMKGGITSGVVYPSAVAELAHRFRFRSIGGSSAGAIAAAATAAAEYGRRHGRGYAPFKELADLPHQLAETAPNGRTRLANLFQPDTETRLLFDVVTSLTKRGGGGRALVSALFEHAPWPMLIGAAPGALLTLLSLDDSGLGGLLGVAGGVVLALLGALVGASLTLLQEGGVALEENRMGLVSGHAPVEDGDHPVLTDWLGRVLERLAGTESRGRPLTFGDLWGDDQMNPEIELAMMTTNVTWGRPFRLPFDNDLFFFRAEDVQRLFPSKVADWMIARGEDRAEEDDAPGFLRLPEPADLPILFATRLSLSFPLLLSAVPLYARDFTRREVKHRIHQRCWFSDGGVSSNFPVHFFDRILPTRPTFAINLKPYHPDYGPGSEGYAEGLGVWMPNHNGSGTQALWKRFEDRIGWQKTLAFLRGLIESGFSWQDSLLVSMPGHRERTVHVSLDPATEGGLHLDMDATVIDGLAERGRIAARKLIEHYGTPPAPAARTTWLNHRWVRYRSSLASLEVLLADFLQAHRGGEDPKYTDLLATDADLPSYEWKSDQEREHAEWLATELLELAEAAQQRSRSARLSAGAPRPQPVLRNRPDV